MKNGWWAVQNRAFSDFSKPCGSGAGQGGSFDFFAEIGLTPAPIPAAFRARVYPGEVKMKKLTLAVLALGLMAAPSMAGDYCNCVTKTRVTDQGETITRQICPRGGREGTSDQGRSVGNQKGGQGTRSGDRS